MTAELAVDLEHQLDLILLERGLVNGWPRGSNKVTVLRCVSEILPSPLVM